MNIMRLFTLTCCFQNYLIQAKLVWHVEGISAKSRVVGYQVTADGSPIGEILDANAGEIMLEKLLAGKSVVVGVTPVFRDSDVGPPTSTVQVAKIFILHINKI